MRDSHLLTWLLMMLGIRPENMNSKGMWGKVYLVFRRRQRKKGITHVWRQCSLRVRFDPLRYLDQYQPSWVMVRQTDKSILRKDLSVPLMYHDVIDPGSLILNQIIPKERTLYKNINSLTNPRNREHFHYNESKFLTILQFVQARKKWVSCLNPSWL